MSSLDKISSIGEEVIGDLSSLLRSGKNFVAYNGFEPSGRMHIAQALVTVMNTNIITSNGGRMIIYIADYFAMLNHKLEGNLTKIKEVGRYFIKVFTSLGINLEKTTFVWASEFISKNENYLLRVLDISTKNSLSRMKRCCQALGRKEGDELSTSQVIYPCMQCADIFELGVDVCQLGMDQRKVNMLAIEYANSIGVASPVIISHHMIVGLKGKGVKMSKSDPRSAIFVDDSPSDVEEKILSAFCNDETDGNPIYEYIIHLIFRWFTEMKGWKSIILCDKEYDTTLSIERDFKDMNKRTLKEDVAKYINLILDVVRSDVK